MRPPTRLLTVLVVALLVGAIAPTQLGGWLRDGWAWTWETAGGIAAGWGG